MRLIPSGRRGRAICVAPGVLLCAVVIAGLAGCSRSVGSVSGLRLTPEGSSLLVAWNPVPNATGYDVYLDTVPTVSDTTHSIAAQTELATQSIANLTTGITYYCVVAAYGQFGFALGPASDVASVYLGGASPGSTSNGLPYIEAMTAYPGNTPGQVLLAATADDSDGDTLTYSWSVDGVALSSSSPQVVWQGTPGSGSHTATVTVSDGTTSVSQPVGFTI